MTMPEPRMTDNPALKGREDRYCLARVDIAATLESWRGSLFSFEWLEPDGAVRSLDSLPLHERDKRLEIEDSLRAGLPLPRPVLGIGLMDNVEIGSARAVFLTLAAQGETAIEVHIPVSCKADFKKFILP
ncbi:MAG: hypothetical protein WC989_06160 [Micavibrio sp.]